MVSVNGGEPTAAKRIRELMTSLVELPELSRRAKEPVRVLIRVISAGEYLEATQEIATSLMDGQEREEYRKALDERGRAELARKAQQADDRVICLAVLSPKVVEADSCEEETIPISALGPDRLFLIQRILGFSGLLAMPAAVKEGTAPVAPFPGAGGAVGVGPISGGAAEPAAVGDPRPVG